MIGGERRAGRAPRPDLRRARARRRRRRAHRRAGPASRARPSSGYLHCGPTGAGHFVKMVHNGIEYGLMAAYAEGLNILEHADVGLRRARGRRRDRAAARTRSTTSTTSISPRSPRSGAGAAWSASWLLDLTAAALARRARRSSGFVGPGLGLGRGTLDGGGRRSTRACPPTCSATALFERFTLARRGRVRRQASCRPCASSSAATRRSAGDERPRLASRPPGVAGARAPTTRELARRPPARAVRRGSRARRAARASRRRPVRSTTPSTGSPTRRSALLVALAERAGLRRAHRRHVRGRAHQHHRGPRRAARRAAHAARRARSSSTASTSCAEVHEVLDRMAAFADRVRSGEWVGAHRPADPRPSSTSASAAPTWARRWPTTRSRRTRERGHRPCRFVSNVDGTDFCEATRDLDPAETLFIVSSKTFTTLETLTNAQHRARRGWSPRSATRRPSPSTSSPCPRTPTAVAAVRHRHRRTCSASGTGSAAATRSTRPSACR